MPILKCKKFLAKSKTLHWKIAKLWSLDHREMQQLISIIQQQRIVIYCEQNHCNKGGEALKSICNSVNAFLSDKDHTVTD